MTTIKDFINIASKFAQTSLVKKCMDEGIPGYITINIELNNKFNEVDILYNDDYSINYIDLYLDCDYNDDEYREDCHFMHNFYSYAIKRSSSNYEFICKDDFDIYSSFELSESDFDKKNIEDFFLLSNNSNANNVLLSLYNKMIDVIEKD